MEVEKEDAAIMAEDASVGERGSIYARSSRPVHTDRTVGDEPKLPSPDNVKRKYDSLDTKEAADASNLPSDAQPLEQSYDGVDEGHGPKRAKICLPECRSPGAKYAQLGFEDQNRLKIHGLTPELWKQILSLLPPVFLGRLLRVSRAFNFLLTPGTLHTYGNHEDYKVDPQAIWLASRRRYAAGLPEALPGQSELEMWRMIRGNSCQICKAEKPLLTMANAPDSWHPPLEDGVRVVWPFAVRCCSSCLQDYSEQVSFFISPCRISITRLRNLPCISHLPSRHFCSHLFLVFS